MCTVHEEVYRGDSPVCYKVALKIDDKYFSVASKAEYISEEPIEPVYSAADRFISYFNPDIFIADHHWFNPDFRGKTAAFCRKNDAKKLRASLTEWRDQLISTKKHHERMLDPEDWYLNSSLVTSMKVYHEKKLAELKREEKYTENIVILEVKMCDEYQKGEYVRIEVFENAPTFVGKKMKILNEL